MSLAARQTRRPRDLIHFSLRTFDPFPHQPVTAPSTLRFGRLPSASTGSASETEKDQAMFSNCHSQRLSSRRIGLAGAAALLIASSATPAFATDRLVPSQFASINAAVTASVNGDVVIVAPGTYSEAVSFAGKTITIMSSDGAATTILDGTGLNNAVVRADGGSASGTRLEGFTIRDGIGFLSGIRWGGGIYINNASVAVVDCIIRDNNAAIGGGAVVRGATSTCSFENCQFIVNTATSGGGGLNTNNCGPVTVTDCLFDANVASGTAVGGGLESIGTNTVCTLAGCEFVDNLANQGGGVDAVSGAIANLNNCTFTTNHANNAGGAVSVRTAIAMSVTNCTFTDNTAGSFGGALNLLSANAGLSITGCDFDSNEAPQGGAIQLIAAGATFSGCSITNNTATVGGTGGGISHGQPSAIFAMGTTTLCGNTPSNVVGSYTDNGGNTLSETCKPDVPGDITGDGIVNVADLLAIIGTWGACPKAPDPCPTDLTGNGLVNVEDLLFVIGNWG